MSGAGRGPQPHSAATRRILVFRRANIRRSATSFFVLYFSVPDCDRIRVAYSFTRPWIIVRVVARSFGRIDQLHAQHFDAFLGLALLFFLKLRKQYLSRDHGVFRSFLVVSP
jgi:hypothetical protein